METWSRCFHPGGGISHLLVMFMVRGSWFDSLAQQSLFDMQGCLWQRVRSELIQVLRVVRFVRFFALAFIFRRHERWERIEQQSRRRATLCLSLSLSLSVSLSLTHTHAHTL